MMFYDVDVPGARARWTGYQGYNSVLQSWLNGNPLDCLDRGNGPNGWYVDAPASGSAFFDFAGAPVITADQVDLYQGFVDSILPAIPLLGGNPLNCLDRGNGANGWYVDAPTSGSAFFDFSGSVSADAQAVYSAINLVKVFGTIVWVKFLPNLTSPLHQ
jgi:hypothetical protein